MYGVLNAGKLSQEMDVVFGGHRTRSEASGRCLREAGRRGQFHSELFSCLEIIFRLRDVPPLTLLFIGRRRFNYGMILSQLHQFDFDLDTN